ncbi:phage tail sheath subtilisin-like domain-containing protein [Aliiglaciecola sp. NS0011-25]|uniref:phage tail sheath family protein n=1 Tax=Aliiglaciecola sp. NS0011-25 TaxID=3127654 RepID=UPI00310AFEFF
MPEYLAPGVFVEEVSFRSKSIEGVPTSTTGFAGMAKWGPVCYREQGIQGPTSCEPRLITSFTEFERVYGALENIQIDDGGTIAPRLPYLAHSARAFFENGGKRLYVSRVFAANTGADSSDFDTAADAWGIGRAAVPISGNSDAILQARWPGEMGNMFVKVLVTRSKNIAYENDDLGLVQVRGVQNGAVVEVTAEADLPAPVGNQPLDIDTLRVVSIDSDGQQTFISAADGSTTALVDTDVVQLIQLRIQVTIGSQISEYAELATDPAQKRYLGRIFDITNPEDPNCPFWFNWEPTAGNEIAAAQLAADLRGPDGADDIYGYRFEGGNDGVMVSPDDLTGSAADPDDASLKATGLEALAEVEDIAIVALPDSGDMGSPLLSRVAAQSLVSHAERERYRIAVVDGPINSSLNEIRDFRAQFDSKSAALYYPWINIFDPNERFSQGTPPRQIALPPCGFITGIYARNDIERGVHKAPANEVIRGLTRFELNINKPRNEVINPEGINALRYFEGRGFRVWGARTMSSDPEWKYVNVRRLFIFIENSIDQSSQWAVFEPNNRILWDNIRRMVEDFLLVLWRDGALLGAKPEDAFFVRCDRTTMTQNDLDNGRLVCLIGIAPVKPAEFVIFRIGQYTADAS